MRHAGASGGGDFGCRPRLLFSMIVPPLALLSLLHPVADLSASRFSVHPSVAIGIAVFSGLYLWRARQANDTDALLTSAQRVSFFTAMALLFVTLNGPLHDLS